MNKAKTEAGRKGQKGRPGWDAAFRRHVALAYINGDQTLKQLAKKFNVPNQTISRWALHYSSELAVEVKEPTVTEQEQKDVKALHQELAALKKKLEFEQMRNFALETMAYLAQTELGIDIRKNFGAKQPKE